MIPLVQPIFGEKEKNIIGEIIDSRILASGKYVERFEAASAAYSGARYAVATSNGTTALHAALLAAGVGPGDKVITTPFTFIATANSILYCGARPLFADIDPATFDLSPAAVEALLRREKNVKAVLLVHLYGMPCDMDAFSRLKTKYRVLILEDCAQAHGAKYGGKTVGTFGKASAFSYYATKNISTGEGGIILTDDPRLDRRARQIINHGRKGHSTHTMLGYNYRLTNIAAGIGLVQLEQLDGWSAARRENAAYLSRSLADVPWVTTPAVPAGREPVFHQYTLRVTSSLRRRFMEHLGSSGVGCGIYYPHVVYRQPFYRALGYRPGTCPEAEKAATEVVSLPVHPALGDDDRARIVEAVRSFRP